MVEEAAQLLSITFILEPTCQMHVSITTLKIVVISYCLNFQQELILFYTLIFN